MTDRVSERIWRAARAAYESRVRSPNAAMLAPSEALVMDWKKVSQERRDIEYDAMVAAIEAVDALWQMGPEAQSEPQQVVQAVAQSIFDRAERAEKADARIAELEAAGDDARACVNMLLLCGEEGGKRQAEKPAAYLRRLIDALIKAEARVRFLEGRIDAAVVELQRVRADHDHQKVLAERFMKAEHELSDAYLRLREMIPGALELEVVPDLRYGDNVPWAHTEACLKRMVDRIAELETKVRRLQNNEENDCDLLGMHERRIAELEAVERELRTALGSAINDRDGFWKERDALRAALKPFAAYAERIEKERAELASMAPTGIPMAWFIAALKAYRGEDSKTEDKT